uniref:Uncharacterized protein n=1 Tax=Anguilla anguilla TaxID=7936 RepID=A0A0E9WZ65_ANGAN
MFLCFSRCMGAVSLKYELNLKDSCRVKNVRQNGAVLYAVSHDGESCVWLFVTGKPADIRSA